MEWKLFVPTTEELNKEYKPTLFTAEPPQELSESIQLLKFQKESLHWMIHQENGMIRNMKTSNIRNHVQGRSASR